MGSITFRNSLLIKRSIQALLVTSVAFSVGCSTRAQGGTLLGAATGAGLGSMVGSGKGQAGAMLGLGLLGALAGNQLFDKEADSGQDQQYREDEYRRRLDDQWRRDENRYRDREYYDREDYDRREYDRRNGYDQGRY
jgi:uncharacterized protein YcfJ